MICVNEHSLSVILLSYAAVMDKKHRRSSLVQGGLEIPVKVVIEVEATTSNREIRNKYKQRFFASYKEPERNRRV